MKKFTLLLIIMSSILTGYAQKQANFWYFGDYAGLNFSMGIPVALTDGALSTGEGCSSISTSAGNLQFYTDGRFVYDRTNTQMPHGSGLLGHSSSTQSGIIVPKPGSTTQYYIFTVDAKDNGLQAGLCYTRVDMTLNNGYGDVVTSEKNISLLPYSCEKVTAVGHSDGISIWVITHQWGSDAFYAYKVTTSGVDTNPVISHTGEALTGDMEASKGYIKTSPDGTKLAMANNTAFTVGIFNFSNLSGGVSEIVTDHNFVNPGGSDPGGPYGVEFSANSHYLYIGEWKANRRISQYDVSSGDAQTILNSKVTVATVGQNADPIGALQLGPDNRMYIARQGSPYLSRINSPNIQGVGCGFVDNAVNLAGRQSRYGLPPFIQSFFYLSADFYWDVPTCDGSAIQFYTSASDTPDSVLWNFGDPGSGPDNTSTLINPTHLYGSTGTYWVTLNVYLYGVMKNAFHIMVIHDQPYVYIGNDTTICASEPFVLDADTGFVGYLWQNGDTTQTTLAETTGWYWCQVTGEGGCTDIDSLYMTINPVPVVNAGPDITIPSGVSTMLQGSVSSGSGDFTFQWEPANLLVNPNILQPTTVNMSYTTQFTLTVTDNQGGCVASDQMMVIISGGVLACNPTADPAAICYGDNAHLLPLVSGGSGNYTYEWTSTPAGFNSDVPDPVVSPTVNTTYHLVVHDDFSSVNGDVLVTVHELPVANAGSGVTIPYGTTTTLHGSATGGSGNYSYHWEPANKLGNPNIQEPTTVSLNATTVFELTVTDSQTGCVCDEPSSVIVNITGYALSANPEAHPDTVCAGEPVQLYSLASGGSGNYDIVWTSSPPGFTSTSPNPIVTPMVSTTYQVSISDGFNSVIASAFVYVNPSPQVDLGPDATVCVFDTLLLDAGNPGSTYIWSNGSTAQSIKVATTGIGYDFKTITVEVTAPGGCTGTDSRLVAFDFAACNGIEEYNNNNGFRIYPNPGSGIMTIENELGITGDFRLTICDIYGREIVHDQALAFTGTKNSFGLDLSVHPAGLYLVRITQNGRMMAAMKYLLKK